MEVTDYSYEEAYNNLQKFSSIKAVIVSYLTKLDDVNEVNILLNKYDGNINQILENIK